MKENLKMVSLFSGIGGFEKGFELANIKHSVVFASEIDKYAIKTYASNFSAENMHGDIKKINERDIPNHDILCAGFPCQSFSVAGRKLGFSDIRGTLFFDVVRIINEKKPKYILLENVKNLVSHDGENTIKTILTNISECGYTFDITIINSNESGIPQNRERTYIVGVLNGKQTKFENDRRSSKITRIKDWANEQKLSTMNFFNSVNFDDKVTSIADVIEKTENDKYFLNKVEVNEYISKFAYVKNENVKYKKIIKITDLPRNIHNDLERQRRVYSIEGISPTLLARSDSPKIMVKIDEKYKVRKISPIEAFKIQGFDDEYINNIKKIEMSDTQLYKQSGNAVSPPVISQILKYMEKLL